MTTKATFYFDPGCPWTWITARWAVEAAAQRDVELHWKTYSLIYKNGEENLPEEYLVPLQSQFRGLRVLQSVIQRGDQDLAGRLYAAIGARIHHDGDQSLTGLAEAIAEAGGDPSLIDAADDESWDDQILASTNAGRDLVGDDVGVPIIHVEGAESVFFGPVMSPAPTGERAAELWDVFARLSTFTGVYEIKRSRSLGPQFGPRP